MSESSALEPVAAGRVVPQMTASSGQTGDIRLRDITLLLFQEISAACGIGEEIQVKTGDDAWRIRALDPNHKATGFAGAIGFRQIGEHHMFAFWSSVPRSGADDDDFEYPMLRFNGGPQNGGMWAAGSGNLIVEKLYAEFAMSNLYLTDVTIKFIALLLLRAGQLAQNPNVTRERYWEVERNPGGDFTGDDDDDY